jgi:hypothetical protein
MTRVDRFIQMCVVVVVSLVAFDSNLLWAQEIPQGPTEKLLKAQIKTSVRRVGQNAQNTSIDDYAPPPIGPAGAQTDGEQANTYVEPEQFSLGQNEEASPNPVLKPMQGTIQLADSEDVQKMLKSLIAKKVPTLYQTMMMVENGAATGFIGSMQTINGLLDATIQTSSLQLQMYDAFDNTGLGKKAYGKAIYDNLQKPQQKNAWPLALWAANEDVVDPDKVANKNPQYKGQTTTAGGPDAHYKLDKAN